MRRLGKLSSFLYIGYQDISILSAILCPAHEVLIQHTVLHFYSPIYVNIDHLYNMVVYTLQSFRVHYKLYIVYCLVLNIVSQG